jgi:hypothetical protein
MSTARVQLAVEPAKPAVVVRLPGAAEEEEEAGGVSPGASLVFSPAAGGGGSAAAATPDLKARKLALWGGARGGGIRVRGDAGVL